MSTFDPTPWYRPASGKRWQRNWEDDDGIGMDSGCYEQGGKLVFYDRLRYDAGPAARVLKLRPTDSHEFVERVLTDNNLLPPRIEETI